MLVLTRRRNESISIGDGIQVEILEVRGGRVRLGVVAPASVDVHRTERPRAAVSSIEDLTETISDCSARC